MSPIHEWVVGDRTSSAARAFATADAGRTSVVVM